jgi:hypothetical protein
MLELVSAKKIGTERALAVRGEGSNMQEEKDPRYNTGDPLCDAFRYINDATYAVLPADIAHKIGDFEKSLWSAVRTFAEKELGWIDEHVENSDRLREEWKQSCQREETGPASEAAK